MPFITVNQGGANIPTGSYGVVLTAVEGPKHIVPNDPSKDPFDIYEWTFVVAQNSPVSAGEQIDTSTSTSSGPKSKLYSFLTALLGGRPPAVGETFEPADLIGKAAIAKIVRPDGGWAKIEALMAFPTAPAPVAVAVAAPVVAPVAVAQPQPDLPF